MRRFLRIADVMKATGFRRTFIYDRIRQHDFPAPIKIGPRASVWDSEEVDAWMAEQIARHDAQAVTA